MKEQIFVFRQIMVFSLRSSPDVASETLNSYIWDELHTQIHLLFLQETCTPMHRVRDPIPRKFQAQTSPLPSNSVWCSNNIKHLGVCGWFSFFFFACKYIRLQISDLCLLLTVHLPTSCAPPLKLVNQTLRYVVFHSA